MAYHSGVQRTGRMLYFHDFVIVVLDAQRRENLVEGFKLVGCGSRLARALLTFRV